MALMDDISKLDPIYGKYIMYCCKRKFPYSNMYILGLRSRYIKEFKDDIIKLHGPMYTNLWYLAKHNSGCKYNYIMCTGNCRYWNLFGDNRPPDQVIASYNEYDRIFVADTIERNNILVWDDFIQYIKHIEGDTD